jgi:hypothetical protein
MTISMNGGEITDAIELAVLVGTIVSMLVVGLLVYLMVRPPRHVREARRQVRHAEPAELDEVSAAELLRLMERMESRLEVLERAVGHDQADPRAIAARPRPRMKMVENEEIQGRKA